MSRRDFLARSAGLLAVPALGRFAHAQAAPLRMAVHPYLSTLALIATHRPLQGYLEQTLQRPVEFYTAASFEAFIAALLAGEYDIVISPPHFGVLAIEKGDYQPLTHYQSKLEPFLVVRKDSPFQRAQDFIGKRVAMADKTAFIRIVIVKWFADAGLVAGRHYEIVERPTHSASVSAAAMSEADAGLATLTALKQLPEDVQQKVRIVRTGLRFPHLFTLSHRRLDGALKERLKQALLNFSATAEGKEFFAKTGFGGYEEITAAELDALKPYIEPTRRLIAGLTSAR